LQSLPLAANSEQDRCHTQRNAFSFELAEKVFHLEGIGHYQRAHQNALAMQAVVIIAD